MTNRDATRALNAKGLVVLATLLTLGPTVLFAGGFVIEEARAHEADVLPTQSGGHNEADDSGFWNVVDGFATKTGFRLVFTWDTDDPVAGVVEWGFTPTAFDRVVVPLGPPVDSAQIAIIDIADADVGKTVTFRVRDLLTNAVSPTLSFLAGNAWTSDFSDGVYEINALMQLDSEALPDSVPWDQGVLDMAKGIDILAERVWDASDGYVRLGKVVVTDTVLSYPLVVNQFPVALCGPSTTGGAVQASHTLADFVVSTEIPFDSHTYKNGIDCPTIAFYVGRIGQLIVPWGDDLHLGAVLAHEFGHYAFDMDDLYNIASGVGCTAGVNGVPDNANGNWDISVMDNSVGFSGGRWRQSEFDRVSTPCDRQGGGVSWTYLTSKYPGIPAAGRLGNGLPDHSDSTYNLARGNPDGGALDVYLLDHEVGVSKTNHFLHSTSSGPVTGSPLLTIASPAEGAAVPAEAVTVAGNVHRTAGTGNAAPLATLDASPAFGSAPLAVTFTASASDGDGVVASWSLDFGDGSPVQDGSGGPPSSLGHTYSADGSYSATLSVADDLGATAQAIAAIVVGQLGQATRIGTDPADDTATSCGNDAAPCSIAWVAGAKDGLDLRAAYVADLGDVVRFYFEVKDGSKFFVDPSGDPASGDPSHIAGYQLVAHFETSPGTIYTLEINRAPGSSDLTTGLGKQIGVLILTSTLDAASRSGNVFWADVPKEELPETAVLTTLTGLSVSSSILQEGAAVGLINTMDELGVIENAEFPLGAMLDIPGMGANPAVALPPPTAVPPSPQITDASGDTFKGFLLTANPGVPVNSMDLQAAWFDNDDTYLYIGVKVVDIPADEAGSAFIAYNVGFFPQWSQAFAKPAANTLTGLRVQAVLSPVGLSGPLVSTAHLFELQSLSTTPTGAGQFTTIGQLPLSSIDVSTDIIWFVVPRTLLNSPAGGATASALGANTGMAVRGFASLNNVDVASGPVTSYVLKTFAPPLVAEAGGPYVGSAGQAIAIAGSATGGTPPYACVWTDPSGLGTFANANACSTTVTFSGSGVFSLVLGVTDSAGISDQDSAGVDVSETLDETIELLLDGVLQASSTVLVGTSSTNPADDWLTSLDLAGLADGAHVIQGRWIDSDNTVLDTDQVTVEVTGLHPFVTIGAPANGAEVEGTFPISGTAGFTGLGTPPAAGTVSVKIDGVAHATLAVDTTSGAASWSTSADASALGVGTHTIAATFDDGQGGLASASVSVEVPAPPMPFVTIDSPASGAQVALPASFEGTYSTTGDPPAPSPGAANAEAAGDLEEWAKDAFVRTTLLAPAFAALRGELATHEGYLGAMPVAAEGGQVVALFRGEVPYGLPTQFDGRPIRYLSGVETAPLLGLAAQEGSTTLPLDQFEAMTPDQREAWAHPDASGPKAPSIQEQVGPGGAIQMQLLDAGTLKTFICTASYLFENTATGKYYLGTAGHCLTDTGVVNSVANPASRARWVKVCISNCVNNFVTLGNYVQLNPDASTGYHPVAWANQGGIGLDFGLIEIPASVQQYLRPWMWMWSGPTQFERPLIGDPLVHYGHGVGIGATFATQGRIAVNLDTDKELGVFALGWVLGGDSGSAVGTAFPRADQLVVGDGASGTITHGIVGVGAPIFFGTDLEKGLDMAQGPLGFRPTLVTEDATIRIGGGGPSGPAFAATIASPVEGAVIDPLDGRFVSVGGTAVFPPGSLPGTETRTYWLHRTDCGGSDVLYMDEVQGTPDGGDGCGSLAHPVGYAWEAVLGELADAYPTDPLPTGTTYLDPVRNVEATIVMQGFSGVGGNPQPVPTVVNDMEVRLYSGDLLVGSERKTGPLPLGEERSVTFSFPAAIPTGSAADGFEFFIVVHEAAGPVFIRHGGPTGSFVKVPLGLEPGNAVDLSVDDPTFVTGLLPTAGTENWSATWDLQGALPGVHTLYARARQGTDLAATTDSAAVTLSSVVNPPTAGFTPTVNGLSLLFGSTSTPGDLPIASYAWDFGDGATGTGSSVSHAYALGGTYDVRLVVTDTGGYADDVTVTVLAGDDWTLDVRIVDPLGAEVLTWTPAADPLDGSAGSWEFVWDTATPPVNGAYSFETRLVRLGATEATDSSPFGLLINHAPTLDPVGAQSVAEAATLMVQLAGSDVDGDAPLTFGVENKPAGATFAPLGLFQWTPTYAQAGTYLVTFRVCDPLGACDEETVTITVDNVNRAPVWAAAPPRSGKSGNMLNFAISVSDPDGQAVTKSVVSAPSGVQVISTSTGVLVRWTPTLAQVGVHSLVLSATDGALASEVTVLVTVVADSPPVVALSGPQVLEVGPASYSSAGSFDPEGKALKYGWALEQGSTVLATGTASSFAVSYTAPGDYVVRLTVRDPPGNTATATLPVRIDDLANLGLSLVGDDAGTYGPREQAVVRACATWALDGAPIVGAAVTLQVTLQGPGTTTLPIPTQPGASGTTDDSGCADITVPLDAGPANLLGDHRVDAIVVSDSRSTDAILNTETDEGVVHYDVMPV